MGIFTDLMNKIFRSSSGAAPQTEGAPSAPAAPSGAPGHSGGVSAATAPPVAAVDVAAILDRMASESSQKLDWKHSIVDLMKLVGMDSSVMRKLAENGGTVPQDLLSR